MQRQQGEPRASKPALDSGLEQSSEGHTKSEPLQQDERVSDEQKSHKELPFQKIPIPKEYKDEQLEVAKESSESWHHQSLLALNPTDGHLLRVFAPLQTAASGYGVKPSQDHEGCLPHAFYSPSSPVDPSY